MVLASTIDFTLPLADPVLKFLLILLIILLRSPFIKQAENPSPAWTDHCRRNYRTARL